MNTDLGSRGYDPGAALKVHERDVLADLDAEYGAQWSEHKEEAYFAAYYQRLNEIKGACDIRNRMFEQEGLRPMPVAERRTLENRVVNNRRLKIAAIDRQIELFANPPMGSNPSAVLGGARLRQVK